MKRLLKYYLPIAITFASLLIFSFFFLVRNPGIPLYALGRARLHDSPLAARLYIDGVEQPEARVYSLEKYRNTYEHGDFLVFVPRTGGIDRVTVIDVDRRDVGWLNSGEPYFTMYLGRFLIQTDAAYAVIYASDKLKGGQDPEVTVEPAKITYLAKIPGGDRKIEIVFEENL